MAIVKNINSNYVVSTPLNTGSNITLSTDNVYITGNLTVMGNTTAVDTNNTVITDNVIVLNNGEQNAGVTLGTAGILIDRGLSANVSLLWNESFKTWQITNNGSIYANIAASTSVYGNLSIHDDTNPYLIAPLNLYGQSIGSNVGPITFNGNLSVEYTNGIPSFQANSVALYATTPGTGTTGLYVTNSLVTSQELITKTRSFGYSILF